MSRSSDTTVPKFDSFKPRVPDKSATSNTKHGPRSGRPQRDNGERLSRKHTSDGLSRPRYRRQSPHESSHRRNRSQGPEGVRNDPEPFFVDLRGDPKNVEYGSLHRYSVPAYHRAGRGSVIGAPPNLKIDRNVSTEKQVVLRMVDGTKGDNRVLSSTKANLTNEEPLEIFPGERDPAETELDFLRLKRKRSLDDYNPSNDVGAGIWSFIEAAESSDAPEP